MRYQFATWFCHNNLQPCAFPVAPQHLSELRLTGRRDSAQCGITLDNYNPEINAVAKTSRYVAIYTKLQC
ncbi:hypothetical protein H5410_017454 [Solanum commersonii]|uniref:Uncharacterized protein n=1 Tax=Solanum commersonii TaxID=4109 RepID=A0A9J5ZZ46_SOLCO|nr:hypothetical protein H5410_017454 [Solanum commersonii]